ncbi:hypothetical protein SP15_186 [Bacillus phage SP-15]|uniref:Lipoprotein n=1 Tax=Bacillus phage SP-15 TaxID=1792032 RepID=A0A127AWB1_9CAUD|nr:hypothetical protein SP15_186 [Bacillus phage SP-15]AMM44986.1 hypothetical protein SP15_186 [Bacillus phage SP-15]
MKKLTVLALLALFLVACSASEIRSEAESTKDYRVTKLENVNWTTTSEYIVDERTGCLYIHVRSKDSFSTPVYDSRGQVVGCKDIPDGTPVEDYLDGTSPIKEQSTSESTKDSSLDNSF